MMPNLLQIPKASKRNQKVIEIQSKYQKQRTFFCRLCRKYGIKERKAHLKNYHNADSDTISKRQTYDIISTIFIDSTSK